MSAQPTSPRTPKPNYAAIIARQDVTAPSNMQNTDVCTRNMAKKMAVNEAAANLRAAKVPTQQRSYTVASIAAACAAIIASNSPQHQRQAVARADTTPSPKAMGAAPKKIEVAESRVVSVLTVGAGTMEEQMKAMMEKLEQVMKDNEEKNKKIEELQREVVALGEQKVGETDQPSKDVEDDTCKIVPTPIVNNDQLQLLIANAIKSQIGGDSFSGARHTKPYTRRINNLPMPHGYQPPKFHLFDGQGNPKQHIAHFVETCNNAGTDGDLLVKQFVRSLKGIAFDWYIDLEPESIDSWGQMEDEFLNRFYNTRRIVSMSELTNTKQWQDEPVLDYISRWRALSLQCKDRLSETSAVGMCINGMNWELLYILKGIEPRSFQELATRAHDMEITIKGHGRNHTSSSKTFVERKESKEIGNSPEEAMNISSNNTHVKISARATQDKKKDFVKKDSWSNKPTLKELQAKKYPFPDSDLSGMLDSLLEHNIIQLPELKRPAEVNKIDNPKYCRYHRLVGHSIEDCITLKELIMRLVKDGTIEIGEDEAAAHYIAIEEVGKGEDELNSPPQTSSVFDRIRPPARKPRPSVFNRISMPTKQQSLPSRKRSYVFNRLGEQGANIDTTAPQNRGYQSCKRSKISENSVFNRLGAPIPGKPSIRHIAAQEQTLGAMCAQGTLKKQNKKRPAQLEINTPIPSRKAKIATPQKTDEKKGSKAHTAAPHPSKPASKAAQNENPKTPADARSLHKWSVQDCGSRWYAHQPN